MHRSYAFMMGAVGATEEVPACFDPMADDLAAAMFTGRCQGMNRAFETIKIMGDSVYNYFERLVVVVTTHFTLHKIPFG